MSPRPSLPDADGPSSNRNGIRLLDTSLHGLETDTPNEVALTDPDTTVNTAVTTDKAAHAGTAPAKPGIHSKIPESTELPSANIKRCSTHAKEGSISTSSNNHSSDEPLNISTLPYELLDNVMFHLSSRAQGYNSDHTTRDVLSSSKQDIKNARLSCRVLSAPASKYLIDFIKVDVSESFLTRLEQVSKHPDICSGVQAVHICLAQYDDVFDNDLEQFITRHNDCLCNDWEMFQDLDRQAGFTFITWGKYLEAVAAQDYSLPGSFESHEVSCIEALLEGYRLYQSGLQEQKLLLDDSFASRVSASMANLPVVKHLKLTDWDTVRWREHRHLRYHFNLSSEESITHSLGHCRRSFSEIGGNTLLNLIPNLICTNITSLDIQVSARACNYTELSLSNLQHDQLRSYLSKLQSFRFQNYAELIPSQDAYQPGFRALANFLDACLGSESLQHLFINANLPGSYPEGSLITPRPWPRLKLAVLRNLPASESDLDVLTTSIASNTKGSLTLTNVHLSGGGTWAGILDMLRHRRIDDVSLQYPAGAEVSDPYGPNAFSGNYRNSRHLPSFAEFYVRGEDMPNPILEPPSEEVRDRLLGPIPSDD